MKKLIELLDQYRKQNTREFFGDDGSLVVLTWKDFIELNRLIIISKEYWFIKWLVDNDKIDLENLQCVFSWNINKWKTLMEETDGYERYEWTEYEATESLIMLLSISSSPIDDLISYLK